ncbi:MAG: hypothetical protein O2856_03605 [Planctomycetota bacterium]|nr:hypothetical protein [Planctomycetota bacterium]
MTGIRYSLVFAFAMFAQQTFAQLPQTRITSVFPPGGQQGTAVDVTVGGGTDLDELDQMVFVHPGITAVPKVDANGNAVANTFSVTVASDVPPGLYDVRVRGLFGISNPRMFRVDSLLEVQEVEPNNTLAQATAVNMETIVNARANGATDVDFYRVAVKAGQTLVVRSEAEKIDSSMQPMLQLFNVNGRRLAESRRVHTQEASLVFTSTVDEDMILRVQDAVYGGGDQFVYRLLFDSRPLVDWVTPAFVVNNTSTPVTVYGRHLENGQPTELVLDGQPVYQQQFTIAAGDERHPVGASATAAFADSFWWNSVEGNLVRIGLADRPPISESAGPPDQAATLPFDATGAFAERSDEDIFRFDAKKGEVWVVEVYAERLGSIADPLLMVERVITNADGTETFNRLATEDDDKQNPGGADLPTLSDDPAFQLNVPEDGIYRIRLRDRYADTRGDPRLGYHLSVRPLKPDFSLVVFDAFPSADGKAPASSGAVSLRKGGSYELTVYAYRRDGHNEPIQLTAEDLPAGITCRPSVIGPGQASARLILTASSDAAEQLAPIGVAGQSGTADTAIKHNAQVASLIHDPVNGLPRTARLTESLVVGVMKDEQPFSIIVDAMNAEYSQDQQLLVPIHIVKRNGFDGKVDLSFYGMPGEIDAPNVAIEPGKDSVVARVYFSEKAPPSTTTVLVQGTSAVPYRRNPWQADRAKAVVTAAEASVVTQQTAVTTADAGLKEAQQKVVTLTEQVATITAELATYAAQQLKLRDDFAKSVAEQQASIEGLAKIQAQLATVNAGANSSADEINVAIQAVKEASAAAVEAAKKLDTLNKGAGELAKQVAATREMEATKTKEKAAAETEVVNKTKEVETAQAALIAAQKAVETATIAKTAADEALKKAEEASKANNVNVRVISEPLVITIHATPAKLTAAVPDAGAIKRGVAVAVKVTIVRKNSFAANLKLSLVLPDGIIGLAAEAVEVAADQTEGTLTITAAADAPVGDFANVVIRATGDFNGRVASTDVPVAFKVVE